MVSRHWLSYSSWRRHQKPVSLRPSGARSSPLGWAIVARRVGAIWRLNELGYGTVRLELAFLARDETRARVHTAAARARRMAARGVRTAARP